MDDNFIYDDDSILVVNKPNNMLVHPSYYARNIKGPNLLGVWQKKIDTKLFPVHRLDYKTSGVIVLTKSAEAATGLQSQFEAGTVKKTYLALMRGFTDPTGVVDTPVKNAATGKYKEAFTHYTTLETFVVDIPVKPYPQSRYSYVKLEPQTGRMHQLRKHANKIAHPIIGDHKYGNRHHNRMFAENLELADMFLHASEIAFKHPISGEPLAFKAELPNFFKQGLERLKKLNQR